MSKNITTKIKKIAFTQQIKRSEKQLIVNSGVKKISVLIEGHFLSSNFENGLSIYGGNSDELINSMIVSTAAPSLIVTILLQGTLDFSYDDLLFNLDSTSQPLGVLVNLTKPANFKRRITKNNHVNKLHLIFTPQWIRDRLQDNCDLSQFMSEHKSHASFQITDSILRLSQQVIASKTPNSFVKSIELEAHCYQLFCQIIKQLISDNTLAKYALTSKNTSVNKAINNQNQIKKVDIKVEDMINYIEEHLDQSLTLKKIAIKFSMSISNLQRKFKQQLGLTVNSYIRHRRLEIAKHQLEQGLISVTEAAYGAGYHHPANFTHAFKKVFGQPPTNFAKL